MKATLGTGAVLTCGALLMTVTACGSASSTNASAGATPSPSASAHRSTHASSQKTPRPSATSKPAATEFNPPGDIPDNQVFVTFGQHGVQVKVPEGWARKASNRGSVFTDHYNSIALDVVPAKQAPTVASARRHEVPQIRSAVSKFKLQQVMATTRAGQHVVEINYLLDSSPNPVTGKVVRDAAQRFEFYRAGKEAVLTLTGPQNADNVDPWRLVSNSVQWH